MSQSLSIPTKESNPPQAQAIDPVFFLDNLHLMYSKSSLLSMSKEANFEEAFEQKQLKKDPAKGLALEIQRMIDKLKVLFNRQQGGGFTLETLKDKLRVRISQIKPRVS